MFFRSCLATMVALLSVASCLAQNPFIGVDAESSRDLFKQWHEEITVARAEETVAAINVLRDNADFALNWVRVWQNNIDNDIEGDLRLVAMSVNLIDELERQQNRIKEHVLGEVPPFRSATRGIAEPSAVTVKKTAAAVAIPGFDIAEILDAKADELGDQMIAALEEVIRLSSESRIVFERLTAKQPYGAGMAPDSMFAERFGEKGIAVNGAYTTDFRTRKIPTIRKRDWDHPNNKVN